MADPSTPVVEIVPEFVTLPPPVVAIPAALYAAPVIVPALVTDAPCTAKTVFAEFSPGELIVPPNSLLTEPDATKTAVPTPVIEPALVTVPAAPTT